ncbi:group XIIB secretory phospholipase A2-like protein [Dunckerocampus dactyliophorus]|uniref:group XIIB secretory phospholipase A2-like protein n=1 Tax=Dunckerocampus dactyliophorus TaxID=161453 RepID=UPI0024058C1D|nr:group XIIB secretory phospholipase A2-like protein [Dunckerocampus dactyliophorus]
MELTFAPYRSECPAVYWMLITGQSLLPVRAHCVVVTHSQYSSHPVDNTCDILPTMLLRTVALLLLCVWAGVCATLGNYQSAAQAKEEAPAVDPQDTPVEDIVLDGGHNQQLYEVDHKTPDKLESADAPVENTRRPPDGVEINGEAQQPSEETEESNEIKPVQTKQPVNTSWPRNDSNSWSLNSIRSSFQTMHGYFDSLVELVGGHNGVCQYRCRYGDHPQPRPGYKHQEPNGCSSSMVGFQLDLGIPAMTECCNQLDVCYDHCGVNKYDCDTKFRSCLHNICSDLKRSLGFVSKVQACESMADALYNTVWTLGCRPYMNSQRAACVCEGEERDEL